MAVNIPNGHKIYQHFQFQGPPNYTQIFGAKTNHLATLARTDLKSAIESFASLARKPERDGRTQELRPGLPDGIFSNQISQLG
jgi:hypothetical protein